MQSLESMVAQPLIADKHWTGPGKSDPDQKKV